MVNVRLSEKETCKLVELYREHECMWNPDNDNYHSKPRQRAACQAIAREMNIEGFTAAEVRPKLKNLRGTYFLEVRKLKQYAQAGDIYVPKIKWLSTMEIIIRKMKDKQLIGNYVSSQYVDHTYDGFFPESSPWGKSKNNSNNVSDSSIPNESEIERSIQSIAHTEVTPEMQALQSEVYGGRPRSQSVQPVSSTPLVTVTPDILTLKAVSNSEPTPVTSAIRSVQSISNPEVITISPNNRKRVKSVSNSTVTTTPSGIQTLTSAPSQTLFALIPEGPAPKSVPNNNYIAIAPANKQNARYIGGNETVGSRKRRHEDISSTNSNDVRQINNARSGFDECSDRTEDEMNAFGRFVALSLRKLSMQSALSAQAEILAVLTRYRLNDSTANLPPKQIVPYILTNGSSPAQNPVLLQKVFLKN